MQTDQRNERRRHNDLFLQRPVRFNSDSSLLTTGDSFRRKSKLNDAGYENKLDPPTANLITRTREIR